jgi:O-antigen ligase
MGSVRIGTSGWSYRWWWGRFYPRALKPDQWLSFYAEHFDTVELNATFYRLLQESTFRKWRENTPEDFAFTLKASRLITGLVLGALALFVWQLFPWVGAQGIYFPNTVDAGRTLHAFIMLLVIISLAWKLMHESEERRWLAARWMFAGVVLNLVFALLVFAGNRQVFEPFGWRMHAGFFANENHLALLYVICTPLIIAWFGKSKWPWLSLPVILGLIAVNLVVGSRAGVILILLAAVLSYIYVLGNRRLMLGVGMAAAAFGSWWFLAHLGWNEELMTGSETKVQRVNFWANTLRAIGDYWPWGSGFGTFVPVYAGYEKPAEISARYINRAHNDWLEMVLEGGIAVVILAGAFTIFVIKRFVADNLRIEQVSDSLTKLLRNTEPAIAKNEVKRLYGIGGLSYGNLSARKDERRFWMSASGVDKSNLSQIGRDLLLVKDYDEAKNAIVLQVPPDVTPRRVSVDAIEHWMIYREHPEVNAIIHVHAWMEGVDSTAFNYPCGTYQLAEAVAEKIRAAPDPARAVVGLKNHGLTITGRSVDDILERIDGKLLAQVPMS